MTDFSVFWDSYPADLCNRRGSKAKAELIWNKLSPEIHDKILINMRELMRVDRKVKKMGGKRPEWIWPMVTTWLNGERWNDIEDIKQSAEIEQIAVRAKCTECKENPQEWQTLCWSCYDEQHPQDLSVNREALRKIDLTMQPGEAKTAYNARCREWAKSNAGRVLGKMQSSGA